MTWPHEGVAGDDIDRMPQFFAKGMSGKDVSGGVPVIVGANDGRRKNVSTVDSAGVVEDDNHKRVETRESFFAVPTAPHVRGSEQDRP